MSWQLLSNKIEMLINENQQSAPSWIKNNLNQQGGNFIDSVTSDVFISQMNAKDINELVSMLTSENNTLQQGGNADVTSTFIPESNAESATSVTVQEGGNLNTSTNQTVLRNSNWLPGSQWTDAGKRGGWFFSLF